MVSVSRKPGTGRTQSVPVFDSSRQTLLRLATTALPPSASWRNGGDGSTPESMTATETPLPSSGCPFAPVRVCTASAPRVAVFEVWSKNSIGLLPSRSTTPGCDRAASTWSAVPEATATPIRSNSVTGRMPVAVTAARAAPMSVPCTRTVVGVAPVRVVSWSARKPWTGAGDGPDGAAWAGEAMTAAAATAVRVPTPRTRRDRLMALLEVAAQRCVRCLNEPPGAGLPRGRVTPGPGGQDPAHADTEPRRPFRLSPGTGLHGDERVLRHQRPTGGRTHHPAGAGPGDHFSRHGGHVRAVHQ